MSLVDLDRFKSKRGRAAPAPKPGTGRVWSPGAQRWVEVAEVPTDAQRPRRKPFRTQWVRLTVEWLEVLLQTKSASTVQLAMEILVAEFRQRHIGGEIVLSAALSKLPSTTRRRAARELVKLGLIEVAQSGRQATRVVRVNVD
jgi:hypothetical protein